MPSGHHHRRRSPSPYSGSSDSSGNYPGGHRSRRSHKPHKSTKYPPQDAPPSYYPSASGNNQRPRLDNRHPEFQRSLSEDTYRRISGNANGYKGDRGRDRGDKWHDSDDDYYHHGRRGHHRDRSLSSSRSRSRSRSHSRSHSRGRHSSGDKHRTSTLDSFKPIVEDVMAAFGLVSAKHAGGDHRRNHSRSHDRDRSYRDREHNGRSRSSRSASRGGSRPRGERGSHHDYVDSMMEPDRVPSNHSAALRAAITAAAVEAYRTRKEFGGITPERLLRIAGAAIAAGGLDAIVQRERSGPLDAGSTRKLIESVIGGMKSSSAFGHRIRRRQGMSMMDQTKNGLIQAATAKLMDRPVRGKNRNLKPTRNREGTRLSSLMKSMTVK